MSSDLLFLEQQDYSVDEHPNFAEATTEFTLFNSSHSASGSSVNVNFDILVNGGLAAAFIEAQANFINDPGFAQIFNQAGGIGESGTYEINAQTQTQVVASFDVKAGEKFSFDFNSILDLTTKEIENPHAEYNQASANKGFLLFDSYGRIIDYFFASNELSSQGGGESNFVSSFGKQYYNYHYCWGYYHNQQNITSNTTSNIGGNDYVDSINSSFNGTYERNFYYDTQLTLVEVSVSSVELLGDNLIGNLGHDVYYGSLWDDKLHGYYYYGDKIYGSLGNDTIYGYGGNDTLEGGKGNDRLFGDWGNDKVHGSYGDDFIYGGSGHDTLVGGEGHDFIKGNSGDDEISGDDGNDTLRGGSGYDIIKGGNGNDKIYGGYDGDLLIGGAGNDTLDAGYKGYYSSYYNNYSIDILTGTDRVAVGVGEIDDLTGDIGTDIFVVMDSENVYYQGGGLGDFARIHNFRIGTDRIGINEALLGGLGISQDGAGNGLISINGDVIAATVGVSAQQLTNNLDILFTEFHLTSALVDPGIFAP